MTDIVERARIKSGMLKMGERIAYGSDAKLIDEMADELERLRQQRDELLEALKALVTVLESDDPFDRSLVGDFNRAMAMARTAISKAKGEQQT